jgi:23S rRNA pseudouridine955/2504/2580 synthase
MSIIRHPIMGDAKYGGLEGLPDGIEKKLHLHARRITFPHPRGGTVDVTAPVPGFMRQSLEFFGFDPARYRDGSEEER